VCGDYVTENTYVKHFQLKFGKKYNDGPSTANQRIEAIWGHLRKQCTEYWIYLFHDMQNDGNFVGDLLDKQLLLFCFLAWIQVNIHSAHSVFIKEYLAVKIENKMVNKFTITKFQFLYDSSVFEQVPALTFGYL
jgi:hypothetical protein